MGGGLNIPEPGSAADEQAVAFAAGLTGRSGQAPAIEAALARRTGRPRPLPVRAVLTALLCLALDDRPLFLTQATRLLFSQMPPASRRLLAVPGTATTERAFRPPAAGCATASARSSRSRIPRRCRRTGGLRSTSSRPAPGR